MPARALFLAALVGVLVTAGVDAVDSLTSLKTVTVPARLPTSTFSPDDCHATTVCFDGVNKCGQTYGGCYSDCTPYPTFTPPPCSLDTTTTSAPGNPPSGLPPSPYDCSSMSICQVGTNSCGQKFTECVNDCTPNPIFTTPPCSSESTPLGGACESVTLCQGGADCSGRRYTTCAVGCPPFPSFTQPPCSSRTTTPEACESVTFCQGGTNDCGKRYTTCAAGCFPPFPTLTAPPCATGSIGPFTATGSFTEIGPFTVSSGVTTY